MFIWRLNVKTLYVRESEIIVGLRKLKLKIVVRLQRLKEKIYWVCL